MGKEIHRQQVSRVLLSSVGLLTLIALFAACFILKGKYSPENEVKLAIENVRNGNDEGVSLTQEEISLIRSFDEFAVGRHLALPGVRVHQAASDNDQVQVVAWLETIDYSEDNQIRGVYAGSLLVILHRTSLFSWEISKVEELQPMEQKKE
ncbi:hypothetical protein ACI7RC_08640 [Brevibacillus sp. B_LB10_24]|uniref:hypothetical protein n=1 Tax=Brevibacillus sp. B_LB10_24 TaxID=3380645 RepID=UPI0038B6F402